MLKKCLEKIDIDEIIIDEIIEPLLKLNYYRSKVTSHTSPEEYPEEIPEKLNDHFKEFLEKLHISFHELLKIIRKGLLNS